MHALNPQDASFSRANRLTTKAAYTAVFDEQLKVSQSWLLALYKPNLSPYPRLGIIVSKSNVKKAPSRNYFKRLIREGFRTRKSALKGLDLVILARKGCNPTNKVKFKKELNNLWERLSTLNHEG